MALYDITVKDNMNKDVSLSEYKGKVLLIVNTATGCGFTPQYEGLQKLYDKYKDKGFEILDFPCNQFAGQAPGSDHDINEFCTLRYKTTFPRFKKIDVNGKNESPLYTYLKQQKHSFLNNRIKWNFAKFLVDRDGNVVERFAPTDKPESLESKVSALL
ncbi:MAG: glutathione peroxidase [Lachnospiraceae bacterium]|nr:glutathione peroxidase [Lachnospiraceae bacterium]MBP5248445.1 glutathione peroxidase [Lachnospiraceae bacterium]